MKVLNLYAGIGGNRKLWTDVEITAVEYNQKIENANRKIDFAYLNQLNATGMT